MSMKSDLIQVIFEDREFYFVEPERGNIERLYGGLSHLQEIANPIPVGGPMTLRIATHYNYPDKYILYDEIKKGAKADADSFSVSKNPVKGKDWNVYAVQYYKLTLKPEVIAEYNTKSSRLRDIFREAFELICGKWELK